MSVRNNPIYEEIDQVFQEINGKENNKINQISIPEAFSLTDSKTYSFGSSTWQQSIVDQIHPMPSSAESFKFSLGPLLMSYNTKTSGGLKNSMNSFCQRGAKYGWGKKDYGGLENEEIESRDFPLCGTGGDP